LKGSLAKYLFGDNLHTLTRWYTEEALKKLSDDLHIDLGKAKVTRLDVATNLHTKRPPADYYVCFGNKKTF
jgi:hypothetical protein